MNAPLSFHRRDRAEAVAEYVRSNGGTAAGRFENGMYRVTVSPEWRERAWRFGCLWKAEPVAKRRSKR